MHRLKTGVNRSMSHLYSSQSEVSSNAGAEVLKLFAYCISLCKSNKRRATTWWQQKGYTAERQHPLLCHFECLVCQFNWIAMALTRTTAVTGKRGACARSPTPSIHNGLSTFPDPLWICWQGARLQQCSYLLNCRFCCRTRADDSSMLMPCCHKQAFSIF